jgi:hypothetical protein
MNHRASVVECGGKRQRDTAVACRTVGKGRRSFFPRSTAVSPGQACALPLGHRTPKRFATFKRHHQLCEWSICSSAWNQNGGSRETV